jgi:hypothetical protein
MWGGPLEHSQTLRMVTPPNPRLVSRFAVSALVAYCHEVDRLKAEEEAKKKKEEAEEKKKHEAEDPQVRDGVHQDRGREMTGWWLSC